MKRWILWTPATVVALSGCFATQSDIRVLQGDLGLVRSEAAAADSARQVQLNRMLASLSSVEGALRDLNATARRATDSVTSLANHMTRFRSDMSTSMTSVEQQLLQVQELAGQSQRHLQELRTSMEERQQAQQAQQAQQQVPAAGGSGGTPASDAGPGPNQLFQIGREQLLQKSNETARQAFQDLITKYPDSDLVSDAQFYIAETYAAEGNTGAADSVYAAVVTKYAGSPRAGTALYKRAVLAQKAGDTKTARQLFQEVIKTYPRSDEASLARDRIKALTK